MGTRTHSTTHLRRKDGGVVAVESALERATKLLLSGDGPGALRVLRPALRRYPESGELEARCGDALYLEERLAQAREAYRRASWTRRLTSFKPSRKWRGPICAEKRWAESRRLFREALREGTWR